MTPMSIASQGLGLPLVELTIASQGFMPLTVPDEVLGGSRRFRDSSVDEVMRLLDQFLDARAADRARAAIKVVPPAKLSDAEAAQLIMRSMKAIESGIDLTQVDEVALRSIMSAAKARDVLALKLTNKLRAILLVAMWMMM